MDWLEILKLLLSLGGVLVALYLCYALSKYAAGKMNTLSKSNSIRVLERVSLTQDKGLAVVEIAHQYYLVGFSTNSIEILKELDKGELSIPKESSNPSFMDALNTQIKSRWDMKWSDKNHQHAAKPSETVDRAADEKEPPFEGANGGDEADQA